MTLRCRVGWHDWTAWSLPFPVMLTEAVRVAGVVVSQTPLVEAHQNRRCRWCGRHQQRACGYITDHPNSKRFVRVER